MEKTTDLQELRERCRDKGLRGYPVAKMDADTCERYLRGELTAEQAYAETAARHPENAHLQDEVARKLGKAPAAKALAAETPAAPAQAAHVAHVRQEAPAQAEGAQAEVADPRTHRNWAVLLEAARAMKIPSLEAFIAELEARAAQSAQGAPMPDCWDGDYGVDPGYIPGETAKQALALMRNGRSVYLYGPAGSGKSQTLRWAASQLGRPMVFVSMHEHVMADTLEGYSWLDVQDGVTVQRWCPGVIEKALRLGTVLIVDEFDRAPGAVQHLLNDVLQSRSYTLREGPRVGEKVRAAEGFLLVATGNTTNGSTGQFTSTAIDRSTLSRFRVLFVNFDRDAERELLHRAGCNGKTDTLLRAVERAREEYRKGNLPTVLGTRHLVHIAEDLAAGLDLRAAWAMNAAAHQGEQDDPAYAACMAILN
jgi:MoxR-like ATPase